MMCPAAAYYTSLLQVARLASNETSCIIEFRRSDRSRDPLFRFSYCYVPILKSIVSMWTPTINKWKEARHNDFLSRMLAAGRWPSSSTYTYSWFCSVKVPSYRAIGSPPPAPIPRIKRGKKVEDSIVRFGNMIQLQSTKYRALLGPIQILAKSMIGILGFAENVTFTWICEREQNWVNH